MLKDSLDIVLGNDKGTTSISGARWGAAIAAAISCVLTSKITRSRANAGKEALFGVLF